LIKLDDLVSGEGGIIYPPIYDLETQIGGVQVSLEDMAEKFKTYTNQCLMKTNDITDELSFNEFKKIIKSLKAAKSPGLSMMNSEFLKGLPDEKLEFYYEV